MHTANLSGMEPKLVASAAAQAHQPGDRSVASPDGWTALYRRAFPANRSAAMRLPAVNIVDIRDPQGRRALTALPVPLSGHDHPYDDAFHSHVIIGQDLLWLTLTGEQRPLNTEHLIRQGSEHAWTVQAVTALRQQDWTNLGWRAVRLTHAVLLRQSPSQYPWRHWEAQHDDYSPLRHAMIGISAEQVTPVQDICATDEPIDRAAVLLTTAVAELLGFDPHICRLGTLAGLSLPEVVSQYRHGTLTADAARTLLALKIADQIQPR